MMNREPIVRIGVILEIDGMNTVEFEVPRAGYKLEFNEPHLPIDLEPGRHYTITATGDWLEVDDAEPFPMEPPRHYMRIVPPSDEKADKIGNGVLVKNIVAGRGFHWNKRINQTLSHVLEFRADNSHVMMINEIPIETYLIGVITGEMSGECPVDFMKAQAIAARSWLLGQPESPHPAKPYLWCNDDCCQRYQGTGGWSERAIKAIQECRGEVLITKSNHYCDARYSKSTGGISEDADSVWGREIEGLVSRIDAPKGDSIERFFPITEANVDEYIRGAWLEKTAAFACPHVVPEETICRYIGRVDEAGQYFRWKKELTQESLKESLTKRTGLTDLDKVIDLKLVSRGRSGRLEEVTVIYTDIKGETKSHSLTPEYNIRAGLSVKFLYSSAFVADIVKDSDGFIANVTLNGAGWGHGAGLCQIGGLGRALSGQHYRDILMAYYTDVRLEKIYD